MREDCLAGRWRRRRWRSRGPRGEHDLALVDVSAGRRGRRLAGDQHLLDDGRVRWPWRQRGRLGRQVPLVPFAFTRMPGPRRLRGSDGDVEGTAARRYRCRPVVLIRGQTIAASSGIGVARNARAAARSIVRGCDQRAVVGVRLGTRECPRCFAIGCGEGRLHGQGGNGAGAQQDGPPSNARIAPVLARQTNHSAPFAPSGDATRPKIVG
jgi:hypothetical protein